MRPCRCNYPWACGCRPRYGFWNLMLDLVMLVLTSGFWVVWMIIRHFTK